LIETENVKYPTLTLAAFEGIYWDSLHGARATDPDTTLLNLIDFGGSPEWWALGDEVWRVEFTPSDTGLVTIDSTLVPIFNTLTVLDAVQSVVVDWQPAHIAVVPFCRVRLPGDVDTTGSITTSDIIGLVNFVFKSGSSPLPCEASGDVNCSETVNTSDILVLVGYVFEGGPPPCYVCQLITAGIWPCD
jgi:hypothetical protein